MQPLWSPSNKRIEQSQLNAFMRAVSAASKQKITTYDELYAWSVKDIAAFWSFYADYAKIRFKTPAQTVMSNDPMPHTVWFEGATLNYAENLLFPPALRDDGQLAVVGVTETGQRSTLSYAELRERVACAAAALRREGVREGDRVCAFAANLLETTVVLLACASVGAVFSSCSPDFGLEAARARFGQVGPKLLFGHPLYYYGGKRFDTLETLDELAKGIPSVEKTVLLPYPGEVNPPPSSLRGGKSVVWEEWLEPSAELSFEALPFDQPLYILFSSGTTGLPKAIVHRAGGALLKHHVEHKLHSDVRMGDVVFYFSTCGWMMWNWLVSGLAQGATVVQYEGSPGQPGLETLWRLAEDLDVTFFGTSARYIHTLQAQGVSPRTVADLSKLRTVASTGSPLSPAGFDFVYSDIKRDVHLASISGGTDIVGCFMLGVPVKPVYSGQIQGAALGVDLVALDNAGEPVTGKPGELVCRQALPSMPLKFWNDPGGQRYFEAYFDVYEGLWRHGDLIEITEQGGVIVYGRSDATLNPGGVRIGTAEIYRPLEKLGEVLEACAVGKRENGDESIWLFLVLREGVVLTDDLKKQVKTLVRNEASPRHVPQKIIEVTQLPRTRSGKSMEIAVSRLVNGQAVPNREVMANPEALDELAAVLS